MTQPPPDPHQHPTQPPVAAPAQPWAVPAQYQPAQYQPAQHQPGPYPPAQYPYPPNAAHPGAVPGWVPPAPARTSRRGIVIALLLVVTMVVTVVGGAVGYGAWIDHQNAVIDDDFAALTTGMETAVLTGDEAAWLARVDPGDAGLVKHFTGLYRELRALHVTKFQMETAVPPISVDGEGDSDTMKVRIYYCFSNDTCPASSTGRTDGLPFVYPEMEFTWRDGKYLITDTTLDTLSKTSDRPWGRGELTVADGERVVVAASQAQAPAIARTVPIADAAAKVADRYAKFTPISKFYVYLASDEEWKTWNGAADNDLGEGVAAYASGQGTAGFDVVVRMSKVTGEGDDLRFTLQHEFGHVVTLMGTERNTLNSATRDTVLVEGMAEYIGAAGGSPMKSRRLESVRRYLRSHSVRNLDFPWPSGSESALAFSGAYGVGHFAVSCLVSKYGPDKTFAYFDTRVRQGKGADEASQAAFGKRWSPVSSDCAEWIHRTAGVRF